MFKVRKSVRKNEELVDAILQLVSSLSVEEKKEVLEQLQQQTEGLPISIFRSGVSGLEAIVVYLKEARKLSISEIALLLKRKKSTIYTTYHKAKSKLFGTIDHSDTSVMVPYHIFADRNFAVLESLVAYLKDERKNSFVTIAALLNKKYSTVRTVYVRYQHKNASK